MKEVTCWPDPNMVFIMDDLGNNRYRFRYKLTGQYIYRNTVEAGPVHKKVC